MKLSRNFHLDEAVKSSTAARHGINNYLPEMFLGNAISLAENILQPIRDFYRIAYSPSSWFRCEELNTLIRGSKSSDHLTASAADIEIAGISNLRLAEFIRDNLDFDQLILEYYEDSDPNSGWVHVSYNCGKNRGEVLRYDGKSYKFNLED